MPLTKVHDPARALAFLGPFTCIMYGIGMQRYGIRVDVLDLVSSGDVSGVLGSLSWSLVGMVSIHD